MSRRTTNIVVFSPAGGHLERLLPLIAGLIERGCTVHVLTRSAGQGAVEATGAKWIDIYAQYPIESVDTESTPIPCRLVSHAAAYAEPIAEEVAALRPSLILYDSFEVVAPIVARRLGLPYVAMRAGHAQVPARAIAETLSDRPVRPSPACVAAAATLREKYGIPNASPLEYLAGMSPHLNLCAEPATFLSASDRDCFEPVDFFGSLAPELRAARSTGRPLAGGDSELRVYVSFGTVIWQYYTAEAEAALDRISQALAQIGARAVIALGNHAMDDAARGSIERRGVELHPYADQWGALQDADVFITHHGLNSTHEAIYHRVPMLSYPFFGDQPALARHCQQRGLALPIADSTRGPVAAERVVRALEALAGQREAYVERLEAARRDELETIAARPAIIERLLALAHSA